MQVKNQNPVVFLPEDANPLLRVYYEFNHLKHLYRQGWLHRGIPAEQCESVAEHSFGVALLAMLVAQAHFPALDLLAVVQLALLHDLGEIYAGDITPGDGVTPAEKHVREQESVKQVLGKLPNGDAYIRLWATYEAGSTPEARFVRQIDRLEMALQASVYEHQEHGDLAEFFQSASKALTEPLLTDLLKQIAG